MHKNTIFTPLCSVGFTYFYTWLLWFGFVIELIFITALAATNNDAPFESGQK